MLTLIPVAFLRISRHSLNISFNIKYLTAFISPYRKDRQAARELGSDDEFIEVFVDCPVEICEQRDPKGAYKKAREGIIKEFTGISAPYEPPENPEIHLHTDKMSVEECVLIIMDYLMKNRYIPR